MAKLYNPNLEFLIQQYKANKRGVILEGSSRSAKTWSGIDFLIYLCVNNKNQTINIIRETYNSFKTTLYDDFNKRFPDYGLKSPCADAREVPSFKLYDNQINFLGADKPSKFHGATCDYFFVNEILDVSQSIFDQQEQRCRKFWWADYNPKYTDHWLYNCVEKRPDVAFLRTTFKDNPFISEAERSKILSYEPTAENIRNGTADDYNWKVYGLGLRAAIKGLIFPYVEWIDKFPDISFVRGMDFGFTCFQGDTMITTHEGEIPIKNIKVGDYVLTSKGYKKVLRNNFNGIKKVVNKKIGFDFGYKEICCTFDHNFKTLKSWKPFSDLQKEDKLFILLNTKGKYIKDTLTGNIQTITTQHPEKKQFFIGIFGKILMEKFQKIKVFITLIKTRSIILLKILCWLLDQNIQKYINSLKDLSLKNYTQKKIGIKEDKLFLKILKMKSDNVHGAQKIILQLILIKDFVLKNVIINGSTKVLYVMLLLFVKIVEYLLNKTNIVNKKPAQKNAPMSYHSITELKTIGEFETGVYDLTVEDCHEYFANGILVHNCDPTAIGKVGVSGKDIFFELELYEPVDNAITLSEYMEKAGLQKSCLITADSSDKYNDCEMVRDLKNLSWIVRKVNKGKGLLWSIGKLKEYKIHIVNNINMRREQENYRWREVNGISLNEPVDKWNHGWDAFRYGFLGMERTPAIIW